MRLVFVRGSRSPNREIDYPRVGLISFGHFINDLYGNLMTSLTPYLVLRGAISVTMAGLVLLIYLIGSSILQPIFGLLSDRNGGRYFVILGPLAIGVAAALFGWAQDAAILLCLAGFGGIGTAAFHPQAASMVDSLSRRSKGWTMSLFSMGGNVGFAFGPVAAAVIAGVGLHWTVLAVVPGIALSILFALFAPPSPGSVRAIGRGELRSSARQTWRPLFLIISVIAIRSAAQYALIIFLPLYFHSRGFPAQLGSFYAFLLSICGALGGLAGGHLSDNYGRKIVVATSLALTAPLVLSALLVPPRLAWILLVPAGAAMLASNSVTVVQGQELLPANTGIASGLTLGLGFGLSGIITSGLATFSDHAGVNAAIFVVPLLVLIAAALAVLTPRLHSDNRGVDTQPPAAMGLAGSS